MSVFRERHIVLDDPPVKLIENAKKIHKCTYGLIIWRFRLGDLPLHSSVFLDEMSSDAIQILPQVLMGYHKSASLLIRGVIENSLRHIYFSDHPVEFVRLNRDKKWYLSNETLLDYAKSHFDFVLTEPKFDALAQLSSLYNILSEYVHGRTVRNLQLHDALESIKYDQVQADRLCDAVVKCTQAVNFLLAIFHRGSLRSFPSADKSIILQSLPAQARRAWAEHE